MWMSQEQKLLVLILPHQIQADETRIKNEPRQKYNKFHTIVAW